MINIGKTALFFHSFILLEESRNDGVADQFTRGRAGEYGKIGFCMKNPKVTLTGTPPKILPILLKGFNTIANHWYLLLFPILLDALLWLGPRLKVKTLLTPFISTMGENMQRIGPAEMADTWNTYQTLWTELLDQFNLANALRTVPIGIPSIIARISPLENPLGKGLAFEIPSANLVFTILLGLLLVGFFFGSLYFQLLSRVSAEPGEKLSAKDLFAGYLQSLVLFALLILLLVFILLPMTMLFSLISLVNFGIGQFLVLAALFVLVWLFMPLVFAPHGVYVLKQKALPSMLLSVRLVRIFLPGTGFFVFTCVLISEAMNLVWTLPDSTSWMTLISIGGHAFVVTSLLTASFIYYREGLKWMQGNLQRMAEASQTQNQNGGTPLEQ